ncbi:MAG: hypothetical protein H7336_05550, partial [Bacteriovorax sp.]|nr:hypothetical protein [Bacteriovorax sp.]
MRLPSVAECSNDQFLFHLRADDERGFLATSKKRGNQAFLAKRRFCYSYELIKKYLSKNTDTFRVADFACGTGNVGLLLAEDG